jgi:hypothetical protein
MREQWLIVKYLEGNGFTLTNVLSTNFPEGTWRNLKIFSQNSLSPVQILTDYLHIASVDYYSSAYKMYTKSLFRHNDDMNEHEFKTRSFFYYTSK